jgi:hypothetical protein
VSKLKDPTYGIWAAYIKWWVTELHRIHRVGATEAAQTADSARFVKSFTLMSCGSAILVSSKLMLTIHMCVVIFACMFVTN